MTATTTPGSGTSVGVLDQTGQASAAGLQARPGEGSTGVTDQLQQVVQLDGGAVEQMITLLSDIDSHLQQLLIHFRGFV